MAADACLPRPGDRLAHAGTGRTLTVRKVDHAAGLALVKMWGFDAWVSCLPHHWPPKGFRLVKGGAHDD